MTYNEIFNALIGKINLCKELNEWGAYLSLEYLNEILDLIKRYRAEIERLTKHIINLKCEKERQKAELERLQNKCEDCAGCTQWLCDCANERNYVVEKFAERAKEKLRDMARVDFQGKYYYLIGESFFEDLAKEMKEYLAKEMECDAE